MTARKHLRIATRKSPLAYWQANAVKVQLEKHYPFMQIELLPLVTEGDRHLETSLNKLEGKGLFVKELEKALLNGDADIAVHSMKDVPMDLAKGLTLTAICEREDARDVLISRSGKSLNQLPSGACVGSSSLRRQSQLMALRPDLTVQVLRGNVGTRLEKLAAGEYDAIILAAAGLIRLQKTNCISEYLETSYFLPAPGQGALGVEGRSDDSELLSLMAVLNHKPTYDCVMAERALSRQLGGSCQVPIAAYAECLSNTQLRLRGLVAKPDGSLLVKVEKHGSISEAETLGIAAARELLVQGADRILQDLS
ncbi:hydroxymethylbilane synthase [Rickettsiella endosymbiont of Dermanyssus gallinae]|uniref:hydroxymethylbilane synthase n=1 Tax=Rickettsiella endosymbiont of Dermanyssus gallinae TaxID=2856608 RepID=UPI001C533CD0|nr:hydroxymethylbilane synthase [Rickettsiella endosymbiont of Dermanyssus gallinae]